MAPWEEAQRCPEGLEPWTLGPSGAQSVMGESQDMEEKWINEVRLQVWFPLRARKSLHPHTFGELGELPTL